MDSFSNFVEIQKLKKELSAKSGNLVRYVITHTASIEGQTLFPIDLSTFNFMTDSVLVQSGRTLLSPTLDYVVQSHAIVLNEGVPLGRTIDIYVYKNVENLDIEKTIDGKQIGVGTIPIDRIDGSVGGKMYMYTHTQIATEDGQTEFDILVDSFDETEDTIKVYVGMLTLHRDIDFTISNLNKIVLHEGVNAGETITTDIFKQVEQTDREKLISGLMIEKGSIPFNRLSNSEILTNLDEKLEKIDEALEKVDDTHPLDKNNPHGVTLAQVGGSNPNLLDNWYFANPINQRGQTEYNASSYAGSYSIDRWKICYNGAKLRSTESGVELYAGFDGNVQIMTVIEGKRLRPNTTYTLSILSDTKWNVSVACGDLWVSRGEIEKYTTFTTRETIGDATIYISKAGGISGTLSGTILAVKLELGSQQTLARQENGVWVLNDSPPNYALELAKCQRYFVQIPAYAQLGSGVVTYDGVAARVVVSIGTTMRTNPVVSGGKNNSYLRVNGQSISCANATLVALVSGTCLVLEVAISGLTNYKNNVTEFDVGDTPMLFSADL